MNKAKVDYRAKAEEWLARAEEAANSSRSFSNGDTFAVAAATLAHAYSCHATLEYIEERDKEPYSEQKRLLDLGIQIGMEQRATKEKEGGTGGA